jgi:uncharacterized protein YegP (UPF0339 family)
MIAEIEIYFALDDNGDWGFGLSAPEARAMLVSEGYESNTIRIFSVRVRARRPAFELGPVIDIADKDVEVAHVAQADPR